MKHKCMQLAKILMMCILSKQTTPCSILYHMFDYSLHTGDQTSAENSPSDKDFTFSDTEDCGEDSQEIEPEKIVKLTTNPRPRSDARYSLSTTPFVADVRECMPNLGSSFVEERE